MAKSSELDPELLTCKICQLPYNRPKRLPCLHTFCRACLVYQTKINAVATSDKDIICLFCPLCKQLCELPTRSGIDSLPDHLLLRNLIETIESRVPRPCDRCYGRPDTDSRLSSATETGSRRSTLSTASGVPSVIDSGSPASRLSTHCCIKCEEFLCVSCVRQHKQGRTTSDHLVVSIISMKQLCQVIAVQQLQKPTVVAKLISRFDNNSPSMPSITEDQPHQPRPGSSVTTSSTRQRQTDVRGRNSAQTLTASGRLFADPVGIALTKSDEVVVTNAGDSSISVIDLRGRCKRRIDQSEFVHLPRDGATDNDAERASTTSRDHNRVTHGLGCCVVTAEGYIAVAVRGEIAPTTGSDSSARSQTRRHRIAVVESLIGRQVSAMDEIIAEKDAINSRPHGIAVTEDGHVIISDATNHCIVVFDADFRCVRRFGRRGSRSGQFKSPRYLAVTPTNGIVVSDYGNHTVKVFNMNGDFRFKFGGVGRDPGCLLHPAGVCADRHGNLFVADRDNHRVQMFDAIGRFIGIVIDDTSATTSGRLDIRPLDVAMTSQTRLVVLLTGIEGIDCVEVRVYEVRCSLPPPEVRSVEQIVATVGSLRDGPTTLIPSEKGLRQILEKKMKGRKKEDLPDLIVGANSKEAGGLATTAGKDQNVKSQICLVS